MILELEMGTKDNWPPNLTSDDPWGGQQMNLKWNHKWTRTLNGPQLNWTGNDLSTANYTKGGPQMIP